jgi:hypothetical protein
MRYRPTSSHSTLPVTPLIVAAVLITTVCWSQISVPSLSKDDTLLVKRCADFALTGGIGDAWKRTNWVTLTQLDSSNNRYASEFKIIYSTTGIYVLLRGTDKTITTQEFDDFDDLFKGDVFEVFFHPDHKGSVYLEYEVNAMNKEFLLTLTRIDGKLIGWMPRFQDVKHSAGIKKLVTVDGDQKIGGAIDGWLAELYFPFIALGLLPGVPPQPGDCWHANFCRLDYDEGTMVKWSWSPRIKKSFHELEAYRSIVFE